jgi:thiol-disulfide isomerase/thioredoxin
MGISRLVPRRFVAFLVVVCAIGCWSSNSQAALVVAGAVRPAKQLAVRIVSFAELEKMIQPHSHAPSKSLHVINFWATWCKPCVEEMPAFERLAKEYAKKNVTVTFVSLDFKRDVEKRVIPFVRSRHLRSQVVVLDAGNPNEWIDKISPNWSGAIPATLFVTNSGQRAFREQTFTYQTLAATVQSIQSSQSSSTSFPKEHP